MNMFFSSYFPLKILALKTCNKDISKIIIASSFKRGQMMMSRLPAENCLKAFYFSNVIALCKFLALKTCNPGIAKFTIARSFILGQLIQDGE